ncbi:MAG TPA: glycosyltransferase family 4 protein [Bryobacteraceae bacterium]|nr:glycosyltransferase family 4 protein [Bryobacteraceae bacterium]
MHSDYSKLRKAEILYIVAANQPWGFLDWICRDLHGRTCNLTFILLHAAESPVAPWLQSRGIPFETIRAAGRLDLPRASWEIRRFLKNRHFDLVHTHFMNSCLAGLPASWLAGIELRVHTRHHCGQHAYSDRPQWELPYDYLNNSLSTHVIAPCGDVKRQLLAEGVQRDQIDLIYHGFDLEAFRSVPEERVESVRKKYGIRGSPVIGSISRFIRMKGVQYTIDAFAKLLRIHPRAQLVLANAWGRYAEELRSRLAQLPSGSYVEVPYETDVYALYRTFDVFVHVPVSPRIEGFGQTYVEALAAGVPSVFTKAGVAHDFIVDRENALVVDYQNSDQIGNAMAEILEDPVLRRRLVENGFNSVSQRFDIRSHVFRLDALYGRLTGNSLGVSYARA